MVESMFAAVQHTSKYARTRTRAQREASTESCTFDGQYLMIGEQHMEHEVLRKLVCLHSWCRLVR